MATQQIPNFQYIPEKYALHNSRPEPIDFMWNSIRFTIPACDKVGPKPAFYTTGDPIPGTLVIQDCYAVNADGTIPPSGTPFNWSAKEAIRAALGVNSITGTADGQMAKNGVSFLPVSCHPEDFEAIKSAGMVRYKDSLVQWAVDTVEQYEVARNKAKEAGVPPKPPGAEFYKAQQVLKLRNEQLRASLGGVEDVMEQETEDDDLQFKAFAYAVAEKAAAKAAESYGVDKAKLVEQMLEDPKVAAQIRKKYRMSRRGYMDPVDAPGAEQPPPQEIA